MVFSQRTLRYSAIAGLLATGMVVAPVARTHGPALAAGQTLHVYAGVVGGKTPQEMTQFNQYLTKQLGFPVDMESPPSSGSKLAAVIASGTYDVIYMNLNDVEQLYPQHLLQPLNSIIAKSSIFSNKSIISQKRTDEVTMPDGNIYGIWITTEGGRLPTCRADWMKALHLSTPTTLAQYTSMFKQFKQHYHAYGLDLAGIYDIQPFMSAAGVRDGYVQVNGKWTIPYATSAAIPVYTWLHSLYTQGLLDPNFVTDSTAQERSKLLTGRVGCYVYWDAWVGMLNNLAHTTGNNASFDVEGLPPVPGPQGQRYLDTGEPALWTLPVTTHNTDEAVKFMEYWLTDPGRILGSLGLPGVDYTVTNGKYVLTATGKSENMDHGTPFPLGNWKNPVGYLPGFLHARALVDKYGSLPVTRTTTNAATTVESDYIVKAILGQLSPAQAVSQMHQAMLSQHLIDQ